MAKLWSFSCSIRPYIEYSGLISFRIDWFALFAVQGTLKSLLQYYSLEASILWHSVFFMVQLSHLYLTPGKTISLTTWPLLEKMMSLLFNIPSLAPRRRRQWQPTPVLLPGESQGRGAWWVAVYGVAQSRTRLR